MSDLHNKLLRWLLAPFIREIHGHKYIDWSMFAIMTAIAIVVFFLVFTLLGMIPVTTFIQHLIHKL